MKNPFKLSALCLSVFAAQVSASGFALIEQSASGQGLSYAGAAASTEDASVMWFNPAGMTDLAGSQAIIGLHVISPKAAFSNQGSYLVAPSNTLSGKGDDGATVGFVPNLFWKGQLGDYAVGLGFNVPFGQHLSYDDNWVGKYHATETDLKTYNLNPSIARKINEQWSLGLGLNAQYVDLTMEQKINQAAATSGAISADGNAAIKATSWGYGYNLGLLYQPTSKTQVGISYRSKVQHDAKGTVEYTIHPALSAALKNGGVSSTVNLPATAMFSVTQNLNPKLQLLADATWTKWSDYKELVIQYETGQADSNTRQNFKDSMRYSLGAIYQLNDALKLRTGIALDQTPVSDATNRSPRTPDNDRSWISVGAGYAFSKKLSADFAYSHLFADQSDVNYTSDGSHYLVGSYDSSVDIFSAQLVWKY